MKRWKKILLMNRDIPREVAEEDEYRIASGCCYFHDQNELNEFNNIDDDILKEAL